MAEFWVPHSERRERLIVRHFLLDLKANKW